MCSKLEVKKSERSCRSPCRSAETARILSNDSNGDLRVEGIHLSGRFGYRPTRISETSKVKHSARWSRTKFSSPLRLNSNSNSRTVMRQTFFERAEPDITIQLLAHSHSQCHSAIVETTQNDDIAERDQRSSIDRLRAELQPRIANEPMPVQQQTPLQLGQNQQLLARC